ncbi:MAG: hypothetical protein EZS28_030047 [Streblomastix strix]|uniref:Uncharacterized protein n=1 Tax=Streblomastix strix TaxID=222440 RepID=A0A5J4UXG2_9EUKA|nr:MAG: hypothetical protein EZS28_030047 [Streblomastix strix]
MQDNEWVSEASYREISDVVIMPDNCMVSKANYVEISGKILLDSTWRVDFKMTPKGSDGWNDPSSLRREQWAVA